MKIVTYNVNGLRPRIAQFGSLFKLLNSLDADVICFQETKLRRQELTADLAEGYESFFSCTGTSGRGRTGYSDNCLLKCLNQPHRGWAFSSDEVALPEAAEECFTGVLDNGKREIIAVAEGLEEFSKEELLKVDGESLWESLLRLGRKIFVVGDLNIAPTSLDRCDAQPDFENNQFRRWFRLMLVEALSLLLSEQIILIGACLHQEQDLQSHNFVTCNVKECDILTQCKRWKPGNSLRWKGGQNIKLEGSDHAPVYTSILEIPSVSQHSTPFYLLDTFQWLVASNKPVYHADSLSVHVLRDLHLIQKQIVSISNGLLRNLDRNDGGDQRGQVMIDVMLLVSSLPFETM